jgi:hypothetical protein
MYAQGMARLLLACLLFCAAGAWAQRNYRLYLMDGGHHTVREHKLAGDRVKYYSTERGEWEEIPVSMVDLKKTQRELDARVEAAKTETKMEAEEAAAEREMRRITASIPYEAGVYKLVDGKPVGLKIAESSIVTNKRRQVLKVITPIPIVAGKSTVEIPLEKSLTVYRGETRPEFYFRLSGTQQFSLVRLTPTKKNARVVEVVQTIPVSKEFFEERLEVEIFRQQLDEGLYKVWPQADLAVGDYAWIEFTEGKVNLQIWDFRVE